MTISISAPAATTTENTSEKKLPVVELFGPTIQGEGLQAGVKTHFVRFGGCGYVCSWCDTLYAVLPEQVKANRTMMTPTEIVDRLEVLMPAKWVTLTGGDPAMHKLAPLLRSLFNSKYSTCIETQGQFCPDWMSLVDVVTVSPKPPSSGMLHKIDYNVLSRYRGFNRLCVKIVVFDDEDYEWAKGIFGMFEGATENWYMTPGTSQLRGNDSILEAICRKTKWLFEKAAKDASFDDRIKIVPQLHVLAWGDRKGV